MNSLSHPQVAGRQQGASSVDSITCQLVLNYWFPNRKVAGWLQTTVAQGRIWLCEMHTRARTHTQFEFRLSGRRGLCDRLLPGCPEAFIEVESRAPESDLVALLLLGASLLPPLGGGVLTLR